MNKNKVRNVCVSLKANSLVKDMNSYILSLAVSNGKAALLHQSV